jgi:hypothetical protein
MAMAADGDDGLGFAGYIWDILAAIVTIID